jgi:hypothetical protein
VVFAENVLNEHLVRFLERRGYRFTRGNFRWIRINVLSRFTTDTSQLEFKFLKLFLVFFRVFIHLVDNVGKQIGT